MRPVGGGSIHLIAGLMKSYKESQVPSERKVEVAKLLGFSDTQDFGRSISINVLGRHLRMPPRTLGRMIWTLAQATHSGSRCLVASLLSNYLMLWQAKRVHIHGVFINLCYDGTPLRRSRRLSSDLLE